MANQFEIPNEKRELGNLAPKIARVAGALGAVGIAGCVVLYLVMEEGPLRFFNSYLWAFMYFLSLSLGALFFVLVHHLTRAGWSVVIRRLAEFIASNLQLMALLVIPVLVGMKYLYPWTDADAVAHSDLLQWKQPYLNVPFFVIRCGFYFIIWFAVSQYFFKKSLAQDGVGDFRITVFLERWSAPSMILFAVTATFAAIDFIMTRDPTWFSTIFGVYYFAGSYLGAVAFMIVTTNFLQKNDRITQSVTIEHYHDLGKWLFAFVVFWAYIAFSQYMLIWYGNIPEETQWYARRQEGAWVNWSLLLLFGHFIVPFLGLISRFPKRNKKILIPAALFMLLMHAVDIYWLVMPEVSPGRVPLSLMDLSALLAVGGVYVAVLALRMGNRSLIPRKDPRLAESLVFENM